MNTKHDYDETFTPGVVAVEQSDMGHDVASAQARGDSEDYMGRYSFNMHNGQIMPMNPDSTPPALRKARFEQNGNQITAFMPSLATGSAGYSNLGGNTLSDWTSELADRWESYGLQNKDGKQDMRKARRYWQKDPLSYRCAGFLAELMNASLTIECENDDFRDVIEIWLRQTMGHTFRDQFFRELVVTGMVPVFKTLIPYTPRAYRYNRAPRPTTEEGNVEQPRLALAAEQEEQNHKKTVELTQSSQAAFEKYKQAVAALESAQVQFGQKLCSAARLQLLSIANEHIMLVVAFEGEIGPPLV